LRVYQTDLDNRVSQVSRCLPQQIDRLCMLNIVEFGVIVQMSVANNKVTLRWYMPKECEQGLTISFEEIVVEKVLGHFIKLYPFMGNQGKDIGFERDRNTVLLLEFWG